MGSQVKGRGGCGGYRKLDDFLHNEYGPNRMPSYHVPPGEKNRTIVRRVGANI